MRLQILMLYQDDPKKCTAAKLVKFGLAKSINSIRGKGLVLDPFASKILLPTDIVNSIIGIDCSWNLAEKTFSKDFGGIKRRLPPLLAGNSTNYSKIGKLTTVEALAASLFILGFYEQAISILDKFKWGHTFYELNKNLLDEYSKLTSQEQVSFVAMQYGLE